MTDNIETTNATPPPKLNFTFQPSTLNLLMGMMKNYLLHLLTLCSDQQFGQDAVEWAILSGRVKLTYHLEADLRLILGEPGQPGPYDDIVEAYQRLCQPQPDASGLLEELTRPVPLAA